MTVKTFKKKQKHKGRGTVRTITKQVPNDSFFNFFSPLRGEQAGLWLQYRCDGIASDRQGVPRSSGEDGAVSCPAAAAVLVGPWVPVLPGSPQAVLSPGAGPTGALTRAQLVDRPPTPLSDWGVEREAVGP